MSSQGFVALSLTAASITQATALAIQPNQSFSQVTTCTAAASGLRLPSSVPAGVVFRVRNDAAAAAGSTLNVYPPVGGQINSLAANAPLVLNRSSSCIFVSTSSLKFLAFSDVGPIASTITVAGGTTTVSISDNNAVFTVTKANDQTINLPDPTQATGMKLSFISGAVGTGVTTINCGTCAGVITIVGTAGDVNIYSSASTNCTFPAASSLGARWDMISNGTKWQCLGFANVGGTSFTQTHIIYTSEMNEIYIK